MCCSEPLCWRERISYSDRISGMRIVDDIICESFFFYDINPLCFGRRRNRETDMRGFIPRSPFGKLTAEGGLGPGHESDEISVVAPSSARRGAAL